MSVQILRKEDNKNNEKCSKMAVLYNYNYNICNRCSRFLKIQIKKSTSSVSAPITQNQSDDSSKDSNEEKESITYKEATSKNFSKGEKLFIKNIEQNSEKEYIIQGIIYKEYEVKKEEYDKVKSGKLSINILGIEYSKDKMQSNNLKLKSTDENAEDLYIKYNSKTQKYIVIDSTTDYTIYQTEKEYVQITVSGSSQFIIEKNGKSTKKTVKDVKDLYKDIKEQDETLKINLATLIFNKKGVCTSISEKEL